MVFDMNFKIKYNMSYKLEATPYFSKKFRKLTAKNKLILPKIKATLDILQEDPEDVRIGSHKVDTPKFGKAYSSKVNGDLRIIWEYSEYCFQILDLLDIGGHSGKGGVY
jgi:mRNA-degrading endonuclease YafQ of YafQ-DinJ toxin-antitoxin module